MTAHHNHPTEHKAGPASPESRRRRARRLALGLSATTFVLLAAALFLTLFPLLPASQSGISIIQIGPAGGDPPAGAEKLNRTSVDGHIGQILSEVTGVLPTAGGERLGASVYRRTEDEGANELVVVNGTRWLGRDGPRIEIGLMCKSAVPATLVLELADIRGRYLFARGQRRQPSLHVLRERCLS